MFSFSKGRPVAKIKGGDMNGTVIFLDTTEKEDKPKKKKGRKFRGDDDDDVIGTSFSIDEGKIEVIPNLKQREIMYVAGPSGSGKSTFASKYLQKYKELLEYPVYVISRDNGSDPELNKLKPIYIPVTEDLVENPIDITQEMENSIILFDDTNTILNDKIKKSVSKTIQDIMEVGRKLNIYIVLTSHLIIPNDRKDGRVIMNEMHSLTVFPKSGSSQQIIYALKTYFGLNKDQIEEILNLPSRQVTIYKGFPQYVVHDKGMFIL